jgi:hypothetical protein
MRPLSAAFLLCTASACLAGPVVESGSVGLWGQPRSYAAYDTLLDPGPGILGTTDGRARDFAFHNGRLYCGGNIDLIDAGPWYYVPGPAGSLLSPITQDVSTAPPLPLNDPRRWVKSSTLAINTSGAGLGAFAGPDPRQVVLTPPQGASTPTYSAVLTPGATLTVATPSPVPAAVLTPLSLEYVPLLDRFAAVRNNSDNPAGPSVVQFFPHTAGGLSTSDASFSLPSVPGVKGLSVISPEFASILTGSQVTEPALLLLARNDVGMLQYPDLLVVSYTGAILAQSALALPGTNNPDPAVSNPFALAVDEANGTIFVSDRATARIYSIDTPSVPSAPVSALVALAALTLPARRRR